LDSTACILADQTQVQQLIMNLCTNAYHAMRDHGGILTIALSDLRQEAEAAQQGLEPGDYLRLTVQDTGIGIDPALIDRIFDPFFTTKAIGEGTGMGLALVHGIVKSHGGAISVESEPGAGAAFTILLPRIETAFGERPATPAQLPTGSEHILFIDDEQPLADAGKAQLESLGYHVLALTSSAEALEIVRRDPDRFDLVITDQTMPHITGHDLARRLMDIRSDIPVILCTGFSETVSPEKAQAAGIREFVMKPLSRKELAERVRRVLDNRAP
jgi:CheY-like chemotaxis protein/anti-sigma regulatory factor (Ser/Thr protein kinase)